MSHYLLSTYTVQGEVSGAPGTPEEMQAFMQRVIALEADMDAAGVFVFGGALQGPSASAVVRVESGQAVMADGSFSDSAAQIAGFYIIEAEDVDAARAWAGKVAEATNHPIEVRPFRATGRVADHMGDMPGA
jgi:hypothetical protein